MERVPVTIYAEMTPNPSTMKFVANKHLLINGETVEFFSMKDAKGYSPLAEELFNFPFVESVFMASNFITITKDESISWDFITMELREFIRDYISEGKEVLVMMPPKKAKVEQKKEDKKDNAFEGKVIENSQVLPDYEPSELDEPIKQLLDEYVRPAVEGDGGAIEFQSFKDGVVNVILRGSCSGCPSSTQTLKGGIENLLMQHLPEVKSVEAYSM